MSLVNDNKINKDLHTSIQTDSEGIPVSCVLMLMDAPFC